MIWTPYKIDEQIHISEMYSFFKYYYDKSYYFAGEMHAFWECVYVEDGEICAIADDRMYNLSQGSLIFHKPLETHKFHITSDETATIIIFSFSAEGDLCAKLCDKVFVLSDAQKSIMTSLLKYADEKTGYPQPDTITIDMYLTPFNEDVTYSQTVISYIYRLMLSLAENAKLSDTSMSRDSIIFSKAVDYMKNCICENPTLSEIAMHSEVSVAQLKRIFAYYAGLGVHKFFLKLKLKSAAQMLSCGLTVTDVSDKLGFSSQAYFSKAFKREMGSSPSEYKRLSQKDY